jgi:acyl-CoA reductase-like NAD-dependent aldehyde dehydrogenase
MSVFTVLNPATAEPVTTVDQVSAEEADAAVARAAAAWPAWREVAPGDRARLLRAFAALVDAHVEELAELEVAGSGHPVGAARWEAGQVRGGPDRAVELPDADPVLGHGARAGRREHGGGQAR